MLDPDVAPSPSAQSPHRRICRPSWLNPPQRPLRPRRFQLPPTSSGRRTSPASPSCTRGRPPEDALAPGTRPPARARRGAGRARRRRRAPVGGVAARVLAAAGARAPARRGGAPPGRRHRADRPPGRRPLGHADRAHRRGAARHGNGERQRRRHRAASRRAARLVGHPRRGGVDEEVEPDEEPLDWADEDRTLDEDVQLAEQPEDPNAARRFWFEHATGAGKTVAALGFVEASRTGGILILTHRRNLVDQFHGELRDRGYAKRISPAAARRQGPAPTARSPSRPTSGSCATPGKISDAYTIVICDEAHTALGEKTSAAIRALGRPDLHRHDGDRRADRPPRHRPLPDPDLALRPRPGGAPRRDRAAALHPHPARARRAHDRQGAAAPRRGGHRVRPGDAGRAAGPAPVQPRRSPTSTRRASTACPASSTPPACATPTTSPRRSGPTGSRPRPSRARRPSASWREILAAYERGEIDVLVNAQLLAEGWNSPRATVCMHLAPTASKRIYQQRVGRVTRRHPGKEAGIVVDFVHPATKHDDPVVTLHSLLDRDVYRGGAIVVGPVRRGRGRRVRVERRVLPGDAGAGAPRRGLRARAVADRRRAPRLRRAARVGGAGRRARRARTAGAGPRRCCTSTAAASSSAASCSPPSSATATRSCACARCRRSPPLRDAEAFDDGDRHHRQAGRATRGARRVKIMLQALAEKRIGRRDQANAWIWRLAEYTREVHEEYAVQRWPETKRLLGLLVNSSGAAHARNARRLVHAARKQDRRLAAALLAAALAHTPEAEEALRGARTRMARKPSALARELLRNFPKRGGRGRGAPAARGRRGGRRRRQGGAQRPAQKPPRPTARGRGGADGEVLDEALAPEAIEARRGRERRRAARRRRPTTTLEHQAPTRSRRSSTSRSTTTPDAGAASARAAAARVSPRCTSPASRAARPPPAAHEQPPVAVDAVGRRRSRRPTPPRARQRVARAARVERPRRGAAASQRVSALEQLGERRLDSRRLAARASPRVSRSSGGRSSGRTATLRPIPSTTQPSCGRPSTRIPATLRPVRAATSLGHLIVARLARHLGHRERRPQRQQPRPARAARATSAARGRRGALHGGPGARGPARLLGRR